MQQHSHIELVSPTGTTGQRVADPVIEIAALRKDFTTTAGKRTTALEGVTLTVGRHEFVALIGPSGCGKSTLLRLVAGLIPASDGRLSIFGVPVTRPREDIGIVFQKPTLLPWLTVLDNVTFPVKHRHGRVDDASRRRAAALLETVGLADFARHLPGELSGGMQQRAAIARSLLHDPDILLMDEPFSALDSLTRDEMSLELLKILGQRPKTVVFVTHSIPEALLLADRIVVMSARPGRVQRVIDVPFGRPRGLETLETPAFNELANRIRRMVFARPGEA
ncbi:ABC transporter ATP-binding protein [Azospirillum sp. ST 5-10]|uniref:ABC transporter ATP-binding protein n=1 Tax=unclassified Azospirillum TaxID=2630922 RepID=UPI003F4A312D